MAVIAAINETDMVLTWHQKTALVDACLQRWVQTG